MKKSNFYYCLSLLSLIFTASFGQQNFRTTSTSVIGYLEYLPQNYNSNSDKYPVVIFLHGMGEKGANSTDPATLQQSSSLVSRNGPPELAKNGTQFPFILISPQLKSNFGDWPTWYVNEVIEYCKTYLRIDERKIYLTGLSLGGGGTWYTAQDYPKTFAAIAPICGSRNTLSKACLLAAENLPVWAFHGDADGTVPYGRTVNMVNAINACTPKPSPLAKVTIYPGVGHNSWDNAYANDHSFHNPNLYEWMLALTNTTNGTNKIPLANAGADVTINLPASNTLLSGSGTDSDGSIASYSWNQLTGPSNATLTNASTAALTTSNLVAGVYIFRLRVTDNAGDINSDYVKVTVSGNAAPLPNAGSDQTVVLPTNTVRLIGTATDPDGSVVSYQWAKVSGAAAMLSGTTTSTLTASSLNAGSYIFRLTAKDNLGESKSDDVSVIVTSTTNNISPVADAGLDRTIKLPTDPFTLFGTSTDSDGTIASVTWTKVSGGPCTFTSTTVHRPKVSGLTSGTYVFRFSITDDDGAIATDDITVVASHPPVANAGVDYTITLPTNSITLNGSATDQDGTIVSYSWAKYSGPSLTYLNNKSTPSLTATGLVQGTYVFKLTVTDNVGLQTTDYATVIVGSATFARAVTNTAMIDLASNNEQELALDNDEAHLENTSAVIYNELGQKIFEGKWSASLYGQVFSRQGLYIYNLSKEGKNKSGKIYIKEGY